MAKKIYVYSTLSAPVVYSTFKKNENGLHVATDKILIKGGANVADRNIITKYGIPTEVTADQLEMLQADPSFMTHKNNSFIKVSTELQDGDVAAADMQGRDSSSPLVPQDYIGEKIDAPTLNAGMKQTDENLMTVQNTNRALPNINPNASTASSKATGQAIKSPLQK